MTEIKMEGTLTSQGKMWLLSDMVRQTAYESAESLWNDVLDIVDMELNRCAMMCRTKQLDATLLFDPKPVCPAWSENQRLKIPGGSRYGHDRQWGQ